MTGRMEQRRAVRALVAAARHAETAQAALRKTCRQKTEPSARREARVSAEAACARVVRLLLEPAVLTCLASVAGPFLAGDGAGDGGEDA